MKLRIGEITCTEDNLIEALHEASLIMQAVDLLSMEIKVRYNKSTDPGQIEMDHSWITISKHSYPQDILDIYNLKKRLRKSETTQPVNP
jgi:hypothetical protein